MILSFQGTQSTVHPSHSEVCHISELLHQAQNCPVSSSLISQISRTQTGEVKSFKVTVRQEPGSSLSEVSHPSGLPTVLSPCSGCPQPDTPLLSPPTPKNPQPAAGSTVLVFNLTPRGRAHRWTRFVSLRPAWSI